MRSVMTWGALLVGAMSVATSVAGCGGDDGVSISTTQDNICEQVAVVACHNMYQCCSEGEIEDNLGVSDPRDEAGCRADFTSKCDREMASVNLSLKNKHVKFDAKVMNECLEAILAPDGTCATVEAMAPWTEACMVTAFTPAVAAGQACDFAFECVADTYCRQDRQCVAKPVAGEDCIAQGCASGLFCDFATDKCTAQAAAGAACTSSAGCQAGLYCDTVGAAATHTCVALHNAGDKCAGSATCSAGNVCLPGTCQNTADTCFTDNDCDRHCEVSSDPCFADTGCALGKCSTTTGLSCATDLNCPATETCVGAEKCVASTCEGNIVCAAAHTTVDYCQGALQALPF